MVMRVTTCNQASEMRALFVVEDVRGEMAEIRSSAGTAKCAREQTKFKRDSEPAWAR